MNLYEILGVPKDAEKATIKKAYRKKSMKHHPDKGGDPKAFRALVTAYKILMDDDKRKRYDEGESADSIEKAGASEEQQMMNVVLKIFIEMIPLNEVKTTNLVQRLIESLKTSITEIDKHVSGIPKSIAKFEEVKKRWKPKKQEDENPFHAAAVSAIAQLERDKIMYESQKKLGQKAIEFIQNFEYEFDQRDFTFNQVQVFIGGRLLEGIEEATVEIRMDP